MNIHALWCHPRSVSTAFERIMRERGDMQVPHEPFMYHYYLTTKDRLFPDFTPAPGHPTSYEDIRKMILSEGQKGPVFFKDMAYYVQDMLEQDPDFAAQMSHAFLVRDPVEAALSYAKRDPDFTRTELGHEAQYRLYKALIAQGIAPLVLTADQLRNDPRGTLSRYWTHAGLGFMDHAFTWDDRVPPEWESVSKWHSEVLQSGAIQKPDRGDPAAELAQLGDPFRAYVSYHQPFYDEMKKIADRHAEKA